MKTNHSKWVLAACFAVALAGVGCGDDEDPTPTAGTGGSTAGAGGMSGGGAGGTTAGTGGGGAGNNAAMCVTATVAKITAARMACATCVCEKNAALALACANSANCWPLLSCVAASGCAASDIPCISTACATTLDGATAAMPFGTPIVRGMCSAQCETTTGNDGGADDAGI